MDISKFSVARWYDPFVSIGTALLLFVWVLRLPLTNTKSVAVIVVGVAMVQALMEVSRQRIYTHWQHVSWIEVKTRFLGIVAGVGTVLFLLWLLPEYLDPKYAQPLSEVKYLYAAAVLLCALPTLYITHAYLGNKKDGTYEMGLVISRIFGQSQKVDWRLVRDGLLEWTLRGFFLVLNFTTAVVLIAPFKLGGIPPVPSDFVQGVLLFVKSSFLILLLTILPGYMFSARILGTEVKNLDRSIFGWVVTFVCYDPLVSVTFVSWLNYSFFAQAGAIPWVNHLSPYPTLLFTVGSSIVAMELVHLWAEATLGIRSSNLMHRGIITTGPFRFTKHPVYVAKCVGWFFVTLPVVGMGSILHNIQMSLLFLGVCSVYGMRAWAEEKIFAHDPLYQRYATYIDEFGLFSILGKKFPIFSFAWRYNFWTLHAQKERIDKSI